MDRKTERKTGLTTSGINFFLDGRSFRILGGEIHYFRFPQEYWRDRLLALKACGLNTVTTYVAWNAHEPRKGEYDFFGMFDVAKFIQIASDLDLYVILRIGPYICAEWEWGGLPSWLLREDQIKIRTNDPVYIKHVQEWFDVLLPVIKPFQYMHGGPVIALQVENEYASFSNCDSEHVIKLRDMFIKGGIEEFLFVCDARHEIVEEGSKIDYGGMMKSINFQHNSKQALEEFRGIQSNWPLFVSEYWSGWFNVWGYQNNNLGVPWLNTFDVDMFEKTTKDILDAGASLNLYMFAGGTNFGFMNGGVLLEALHGKGGRTTADTTSYDYSALVSEEGKLTPKFFVMKKLLQSLDPSINLIEPPPEPVLAEYDSVGVQSYVTLEDLKTAMESWMIKSKRPISMENFPAISDRKCGQAYGYAVYETTVVDNDQLKFEFEKVVRDRVHVYLDTVYQGTIMPPVRELTIKSTGNAEKHTVSFLVENQGRINWVSKDQDGIMENQHKGISSDVTCNGKTLEDWKILPLEFDSQFMKKLHELTQKSQLKWTSTSQLNITTPVLLKSNLKLGSDPIRDTFIELEGFEKGVLFINGINIGRYWNSAGPQKRLYVPGVWLKPGNNEILIFEETAVGTKLSFHTTSGIVPSSGKTQEWKLSPNVQ